MNIATMLNSTTTIMLRIIVASLIFLTLTGISWQSASYVQEVRSGEPLLAKDTNNDESSDGSSDVERDFDSMIG